MMVGHQQIIEARREGMKPAAIFIDAGYPIQKARYDFDNPERALDYGFYPHVLIDDLNRRYDLRFCVGCDVHLGAPSWSDELFAIAEQLVEVGVARLIAWCPGELLAWDGEWRACASSD